MRRLAAIGAVLFFSAGPMSSARADVPDVYETSATSGGVHYEIAVPAFFEAFGPYAFAEASNGTSHSLQAPLYMGFFLTAAAEQFGFPPTPGSSETLYPQGPTEAGTPPSPVDVNVFESSGKSTATGATGSALIAREAANPIFDIALGEADASARARDDGAIASATIRLDGLEFADGLVRIEQVTGTAEALATGRPGSGEAGGSIAMTGLSVGDVRVDVTAGGLVVDGTPIDAPSDAIDVSGVRVERLPTQRSVSADGRSATVHVGGVRFTFDQPQAEFRTTFTIGELIARSRVVDLSDPQARVAGEQRTPEGGAVTRTIPGSRGFASGAPSPDEALVTRTVRRTVPAEGADWVAIAALAALAAPVSLVIRRAFRAAVRP